MNLARSTMMFGVGLLVASALFAPTALAQTAPKLQASVNPPSAVVIPERAAEMSVDVTWQQNNPLQPIGGAQNSNVAVTIDITCPFGISVTGDKTILIAVDAAEPNGEYSNTGNFQVTVPRTAPGLRTVKCDVSVTGTEVAPTAVPTPDPSNKDFSFNVGYYSLNQVQVATKLKQAGPQKQVPFELEVTNFGNARTQYLFEITNAPGGKWNALPPEVLLLESPNAGTGSPTNTAVFTVATPFKNGWNNDEGAYTVTITPSAADDPEAVGNPMTANMLVRVRGVYVPSLEPIVMLLALVGSAFILRLRQTE